MAGLGPKKVPQPEICTFWPLWLDNNGCGWTCSKTASPACLRLCPLVTTHLVPTLHDVPFPSIQETRNRKWKPKTGNSFIQIRLCPLVTEHLVPPFHDVPFPSYTGNKKPEMETQNRKQFFPSLSTPPGHNALSPTPPRRSVSELYRNQETGNGNPKTGNSFIRIRVCPLVTTHLVPPFHDVLFPSYTGNKKPASEKQFQPTLAC